MNGQVDIRLFDERVSWKVPALFNNDWVALTLAHTLNPLLPRPFFASAYGCPACMWAGGRLARMNRPSEEELSRYFEAYAQAGATCSLTFSRPDAGDSLDDAYCNQLLDLAEEYGGSAIVVDGRLARHIRTTHPRIRIVASNNRVLLDHAQGFGGLGEVDYYRSLLEDYDEVVVRCEALLEGGIAERLVDMADHIEFIVNQRCYYDCPTAAEHIMQVARAVWLAEEGEAAEHPPCMQTYYSGRRNLVVSLGRRRELADMGFTKFKLQGRNTPMSVALMDLAVNILDLPDASALPESLRPLLMVCGLMDATDKADEQRTTLPA